MAFCVRIDLKLFTLLTFLCMKLCLGQESEEIRNLLGSVASDVTCETTTRCKMIATDSYGCHYYRNVNERSSEHCLIETFTGTSPKLYVKPDSDFKYIEINTYHRACIPSVPIVGIGNLASRRLSLEDFYDQESWHEIKVHANRKHKVYQVILDEGKRIGRPMSYKSLNKTHIQIMVRGSALWSYDCDPRDYQQLLSRATVPWIMFFLLAILLVIILVCIIIYCSRKLRKQSRRVLDSNNSFNVSTRSTISLISSPSTFQSQVRDSRDSANSCGQSMSHVQVAPSVSVSQSWSYAGGDNKDPKDQKWSYTANANAGNACKMWVNSHSRFQNLSKASASNAIQDHVYEDPKVHPIYENDEDPIYEEIDDFSPEIRPTTGNVRRPVVPFNRVDSMGSNFSAPNSVYGYLRK